MIDALVFCALLCTYYYTCRKVGIKFNFGYFIYTATVLSITLTAQALLIYRGTSDYIRAAVLSVFAVEMVAIPIITLRVLKNTLIREQWWLIGCLIIFPQYFITLALVARLLGSSLYSVAVMSYPLLLTILSVFAHALAKKIPISSLPYLLSLPIFVKAPILLVFSAGTFAYLTAGIYAVSIFSKKTEDADRFLLPFSASLLIFSLFIMLF